MNFRFQLYSKLQNFLESLGWLELEFCITMSSRFQAASLVASPSYPNAVAWSDENLVAVASGNIVTILVILLVNKISDRIIQYMFDRGYRTVLS